MLAEEGSPMEACVAAGGCVAETETVCGRLVYSWIESMSTEKTLAPSLAKRAASGRPTTSDLQPTY